MSVNALAWAWSITELSPSETLTLMALADAANRDGIAWPTQAEIAERSRVSVRQARRNVAKLIRLGLVQVRLAKKFRKAHEPALLYRVNIGCVPDFSAGDTPYRPPADDFTGYDKDEWLYEQDQKHLYALRGVKEPSDGTWPVAAARRAVPGHKVAGHGLDGTDPTINAPAGAPDDSVAAGKSGGGDLVNVPAAAASTPTPDDPAPVPARRPDWSRPGRVPGGEADTVDGRAGGAGGGRVGKDVVYQVLPREMRGVLNSSAEDAVASDIADALAAGHTVDSLRQVLAGNGVFNRRDYVNPVGVIISRVRDAARSVPPGSRGLNVTDASGVISRLRAIERRELKYPLRKEQAFMAWLGNSGLPVGVPETLYDSARDALDELVAEATARETEARARERAARPPARRPDWSRPGRVPGGGSGG